MTTTNALGLLAIVLLTIGVGVEVLLLFLLTWGNRPDLEVFLFGSMIIMYAAAGVLGIVRWLLIRE